MEAPTLSCRAHSQNRISAGAATQWGVSLFVRPENSGSCAVGPTDERWRALQRSRLFRGWIRQLQPAGCRRSAFSFLFKQKQHLRVTTFRELFSKIFFKICEYVPSCIDYPFLKALSLDLARYVALAIAPACIA